MAGLRHYRAVRETLDVAYTDPDRPPAGVLAYVPEAHADRRCPRRYSGGREVIPDDSTVWCDVCTTDDPTVAGAIMPGPDGGWRPYTEESP